MPTRGGTESRDIAAGSGQTLDVPLSVFAPEEMSWGEEQ